MKKGITLALAICFALLLSVTAFADVAPPTFSTVTVGEKPIPRYTLEYTDGVPDALRKDGTIPAGYTIRVSDVVLINGQKYGMYTVMRGGEPATNEYGVRVFPRDTYHLLLADVLAPEEVETAQGYSSLTESDNLELPVVSQSDAAPTTTTEPTTTVAPTTTAAPPTTTAETTATQTQTQPQTERPTTTAETGLATQTDTTVLVTQTGNAENGAQRGTLQKKLFAFFAAAVILTLTAAVTLTLIRRHKKNPSKKKEAET